MKSSHLGREFKDIIRHILCDKYKRLSLENIKKHAFMSDIKSNSVEYSDMRQQLIDFKQSLGASEPQQDLIRNEESQMFGLQQETQ